MVPTGAFDQRVTVQRPTTAADVYLGRSVTWTDVDRPWAAVKSTSDTERLSGAQIQAIQTHAVTVWYASVLAAASTTWRILWNNRVLQIFGIDGLTEQRHQITFQCREVEL